MKIAIFHGTMGNPAGNWFPWIKQKLESDHTVSVPALPTPDGQNVSNWIEAVRGQISDIQNYDVLIGHSCGASFIPHLVVKESFVPKQIFLVSPFIKEIGLPEYDKLNESFFLNDQQQDLFFDYVKFKNINLSLFHGDNDPYVPISQAYYLAEKLDTPLRVVKNGGHLNAEFGFTTFPELYDAIL